MKDISDETVDAIADHINKRVSQSPHVGIATVDGAPETAQYYEIIPFNKMDDSDRRFFAVDGSYNSQQFHNGIYVGLYRAGYVCYHGGKQIRVNDHNDPVKLGKSYSPKNILITNEMHRHEIFEELLMLEPVKKMLCFFHETDTDSIWGMGSEMKTMVTSSVSKLFSFCQEVLEWSLVLEIMQSPMSRSGDFILRDGTLRSNTIKQKYLKKLGKYAVEQRIHLIAITKNSPIKLELSSSFKQIDAYLENEKKPSYPFTITIKRWQKLCCWFEVSDNVLLVAYPEASQRRQLGEGKISTSTKYSMYATRNLNGGRGFGLFFVARLDYVEKLQNYDWVIADLNIFEAIPGINDRMKESDIRDAPRNMCFLSCLFKELTRLTQEHYILGYPYPLVEAHNFVTLNKDFKEEVINRVKASLYQSQMMDHVDIENIFLDTHDRF